MDDLLDGDVSGPEHGPLDEHLACCNSCARHGSEIRAVDDWARHLQPTPPSAGFADAVMARIVAKEPVSETSATGIEMIAAAVLAMAVISAMLGASEAVYEWLVAAAGSLRDVLGAAAADLADAGREGLTAAASLAGPLDQVKGYVSPAWAMAAIGGAALLVVVFDLVQARAVARKTM